MGYPSDELKKQRDKLIEDMQRLDDQLKDNKLVTLVSYSGIRWTVPPKKDK